MRETPISVVTPDEKGVIVVYQCVAMAREGEGSVFACVKVWFVVT